MTEIGNVFRVCYWDLRLDVEVTQSVEIFFRAQYRQTDPLSVRRVYYWGLRLDVEVTQSVDILFHQY